MKEPYGVIKYEGYASSTETDIEYHDDNYYAVFLRPAWAPQTFPLCVGFVPTQELAQIIFACWSGA